ncbi:MAG: VOC family protein [Deinococcaceae bacterium]
MTLPRIQGIHHVTALAGDPQRNVDFYTEVMGQRLVKVTVNFDDPTAYHLYFGDSMGTPGTLLTFFPQLKKRGQSGRGEVASVAYKTPEGVEFWKDRLSTLGVAYRQIEDKPLLNIRDPDGLSIDLHCTDQPHGNGVAGLSGVTLWIAQVPHINGFLEFMGFVHVDAVSDSKSTRHRYVLGHSISSIEVIEGHHPSSVPGAGRVHHLSFGVQSEGELEAYREALLLKGYRVTSVRNRKYFKSIYFRHSSGILFELATCEPGFTVDEPQEELGKNVCWPDFVDESARNKVQLPPLVNREYGNDVRERI